MLRVRGDIRQEGTLDRRGHRQERKDHWRTFTRWEEGIRRGALEGREHWVQGPIKRVESCGNLWNLTEAHREEINMSNAGRRMHEMRMGTWEEYMRWDTME